MSPEEARGPRVRFVTKRWSHHSTHSGYDRAIDYIGEAIERIDLSRLSSRWIPERIAMKFVSRAEIRGYSVASFYDEWAAVRDMSARPRRAVYHVLDGDLGREAPEVQFVLVTRASAADSFRSHRNVEVKGYIEEPVLIRLYQQAAVVLQPMEESTANNSILEGLACGVPIVATDVGGVGAYVNEGCAVLTGAGDAEGMADAILRISRDPALRTKMRRAAREQAMKFSWPRVASQFAALYDRIE